MNVRVIAGRYGGRILDAPGRRSTHAMSERVRNALFNSIGAAIPNADVLDAFAGSGSLGIEAISRGAASAVFIEKDRIAAKIIAKNLKLIQATGRVINATVAKWSETSDTSLTFDIIFADPPYHDFQLSSVMRLAARLRAGGLFIISHPSSEEVAVPPGMTIESHRSYGTANLTILRNDI